MTQMQFECSIGVNRSAQNQALGTNWPEYGVRPCVQAQMLQLL
jgi:hypothetical protein